MAEDLRNNTRGNHTEEPKIPLPSAFRKRSVATWLVVGVVITFIIATLLLFFEAIAPVADFWFHPGISADANTYWLMSGVRGSSDLSEGSGDSDQPQFNGGSWGPVLQAKLFRYDMGVIVSNGAMLIFMFWIVSTMREFDLSTFTLLFVLNPILFAVLTTLNKEIYSVLGLVIFLRYMTAGRFKLLLLFLAVIFSVGGHWQQSLVLLMLAALESRISPLRGKYKTGLVLVLAAFTIGYTLVYHLVPVLIAALLAQAEAGRSIVILDHIQGTFGLPIVLVPKILMNVMGRFLTPWYFLGDYWDADFSNWYDQIFTQGQELLTTVLLLFLLFRRKLPLRQPLVYLLAVYLILTAVNPMVQPRYEYPAYALLCLQASRYYRLGLRGRRKELSSADSSGREIVPSVT